LYSTKSIPIENKPLYFNNAPFLSW